MRQQVEAGEASLYTFLNFILKDVLRCHLLTGDREFYSLFVESR